MLRFVNNQTGAVTVDWTVLTASLVGLGLAVMGVVSVGVQDTSADVKTELQGNTIIQTSFAAQLGAVSDFAFSFVGLPDANGSKGATADGNGGLYYYMLPGTTYAGWLPTNSDFANAADAPAYQRPYLNDVEGQEAITLHPYYSPWGGSSPQVGISQTIDDMTDGQTYTFSLDGAVSRTHEDVNWSNGQSTYSTPSDVSDASLEVFFGGQLAGTLQPNSTSLTNVSIDLIAGSGDGSNLLEVRSAIPNDLGDQDTFYITNFDIEPTG